MLFTIILVMFTSWPFAWTTDTNLTKWCQQENITPAQIVSEFAVLDSILAVEQRKAWSTAHDDDTVYHSHASLSNFGMTVAEFNSGHGIRLPQTPIIANPDCRIYFSHRNRQRELDTCPTLSVSIYITTRITDMPMATAQRCLTTGQTTYQFQTETGTLEYNQASEYIELRTYADTTKQRFILWTATPVDPSDTLPAELSVATPPDSVCLPANKAGCEPH
ncbi:MAG: hypothetical protein WCT27_05465 [Patescibacteria group bacterium]